jgi:hypothetical protein
MTYPGLYNGFAGEYKNGSNDSVAPVLRWARFELGGKNISGGLTNGANEIFTVDISSIQNVVSRFFSLSLIGDDGVVIDGLSMTNYSVNSGVTDLTYPAFDLVQSGNSSVIVRQILYFGGVYDAYTSYIQTNSTNWDGISSNRGYLDMYYTQS